MIKMKGKSKTMILIKSSKIRNEQEFFELMFPKVSWLGKYALEIFQLAKNGKLTKESYKTVPQQLGIRLPQYYAVLNKLRAIGILQKVESNFKPAKEFLNYLKELHDYYKMLYEAEEIVEEDVI